MQEWEFNREVRDIKLWLLDNCKDSEISWDIRQKLFDKIKGLTNRYYGETTNENARDKIYMIDLLEGDLIKWILSKPLL